MLICDKCGAQIPEGSRFCPQCADPVTEADRVSKPIEKTRSQTQSTAAWGAQQMRLVCPKCKAQALYEIVTSKPVHNLKCPKCGTGFASRVVVIRAKRSRGSKKENKRHFDIRVIEPSGKESLIKFVKAGYDDFELRSKDVAAFHYQNDKLRIMQNLTIGRYMIVSEPSCYLATYVYGSTSEAVTTLRSFRDDVLLGSRILSPVVSLYYRVSPVLIGWLGNNRMFQAISLTLLSPIVRGADWYLHHASKPKRVY